MLRLLPHAPSMYATFVLLLPLPPFPAARYVTLPSPSMPPVTMPDTVCYAHTVCYADMIWYDWLTASEGQSAVECDRVTAHSTNECYDQQTKTKTKTKQNKTKGIRVPIFGHSCTTGSQVTLCSWCVRVYEVVWMDCL